MAGKKKKILIIEDEKDLVFVVRMRLESKGFSVSEGFSAKEALEKAQEKPDLILIDLILPDGDGYQLCQRLKSNPQTSHIPIIIFTASNLKDLAKKAVEAGAIDYIIKPFDPKELLEKINKALQ